MKKELIIGIKNFIKSPRIIIPVVIYLILLGPVLYLYSGSPPETEVQVYKGVWFPYVFPSSLAEMKDIGVNTVFLQSSAPGPLEKKLMPFGKNYILFEKELLIANIKTAHRNGMGVILTTGIMPPYPEPSKINKKDFNSKIIELAKLAEKYEVEFFAPLNEPDYIIGENFSKWDQEILPKIKEVYNGKVIWRGGVHGNIDKMLSGEWPTNFSGYDYMGCGLTPHADITIEDYPQFVDDMLNTMLSWAERDNVKGVMITEFGAWEWGYTAEPGGASFQLIRSEEDIVRAHEIALERGKDKVVGFFVLDVSGSGTKGKVGEVIKKWYKEIL